VKLQAQVLELLKGVDQGPGRERDVWTCSKRGEVLVRWTYLGGPGKEYNHRKGLEWLGRSETSSGASLMVQSVRSKRNQRFLVHENEDGNAKSNMSKNST